MKKLLLLLCLAASTTYGQLIISPAPTPGVSGGGGDALVADPLSQFASTTSAQLATVISDETGSGSLVFGNSPTLAGATVDGGPLVIQGDQSAAAWTTNGIRLKGVTGTLTDTSSSGTVAAAYTDKLGGNTIAASSASVFTNYISLYVSAPIAGTNVTLTNKWALGGDSLYVGTSNPVKITAAGVLTATSPVLTTPDLGTPTALTLSAATGLPVSTGITGFGTGVATFLGTPTSANLATAVTNETGSGALVFGTSPALVTPDLGTPTALTLTSATGLPVSGITASTSTALGVGSIELGHATDTTLSRASSGVLAVEGTNVLLNGGALGTPSSGTLTNATGLPVAGITASTSTALGVGSIELGAATDTTIARSGAGAITVEGTAVLLSGGALGTPSSGTLTNATGLPIAGLSASTSTALGVGSIELGAASDTTIARSGAGAITVEGVAVDTVSATSTLSNKRLTPRVTTIVSNATPTVNTDNTDAVTITALAAAITSMTTNLSGAPANFDKLIFRIKDDGTARAITWGASFEAKGVALPTTTVISKVLTVGFIYDSVSLKWGCVASLSEA